MIIASFLSFFVQGLGYYMALEESFLEVRALIQALLFRLNFIRRDKDPNLPLLPDVLKVALLALHNSLPSFPLFNWILPITLVH